MTYRKVVVNFIGRPGEGGEWRLLYGIAQVILKLGCKRVPDFDRHEAPKQEMYR